MGKYTSQSTSKNSARIIEPIVISKESTTRKVMLAQINDVKKDTGETLSVTLLHQRKSNKEIWEDIESINLNTLKAGEGVKLHLNSSQTKLLFEGLQQLYKLSESGVFPGEREFVVDYAKRVIQVPEDRKEFIQKLLNENYGEEIWTELIANDPDLATRLSLAKLQQNRLIALKEFEDNIGNNSLTEVYWQKFFSNNKWIFGYGLNYVFLSPITDQPSYGGADISGKGGQRGDYLLHSNAAARYTLLVEIKRSTTPLLARNDEKTKYYRNGACLMDAELVGSIAQLQVNCKSWQKKALESNDIIKMYNANIHTVQPKGILIIGNLSELNSEAEKVSFELFRRNIANPEIITYDELLERAKFIVRNEETNIKEIEQDEENILL